MKHFIMFYCSQNFKHFSLLIDFCILENNTKQIYSLYQEKRLLPFEFCIKKFKKVYHGHLVNL